MILPPILDGEDKSSPLKNRIRKNYQHLKKWAKRSSTDCFRIYDRDIKEYPVAIDIYAGRFCVHYFSFDRDEEIDTTEVDNALRALFGECEIFSRTRKKRRKMEQYEKAGEEKQYFTALEHGVKFAINLQDYLDTGLFLDHRLTRQLIAKEAAGKRLLNLFAYTCSFSVQAAFHGATFTKSVDMSNTYTKWGRRNFILNNLSEEVNPIVREDCMRFLREERDKYDVIVIDPPTISRSKRMIELFDIQRDYAQVLNLSLRLLKKDGVVYFSTNSRKFNFDIKAFSLCRVEEISYKTIPEDFQKKNIHRCWKIRQSLQSSL